MHQLVIELGGKMIYDEKILGVGARAAGEPGSRGMASRQCNTTLFITTGLQGFKSDY